MIEFNADQNEFRICIPVSNIDDVHRYHQSIINILDRIEIDECSTEFREDLNSVYELLSKLIPHQEFLDDQ
jgi:hypothetical protein